MDLKDLFLNIESHLDKEVTLNGWVRSNRDQKNFGFIDFSDGTTLTHLQIVYSEGMEDFDKVSKILIGSAIEATGKIVKSQGNQDYEMQATKITVLGDCPSDYPLQAKGRPTREFLREIAYLRPRTNLFQAVFRVRSVAAYAIHKYFQENNFVYAHTPIITASDCEGAGEMFQVTTLDLERVKGSKEVDYSKDFFAKPASLTVSGQLQAETFALAYKKTYTFGPTFRAENSNTKTHASEFWMIEPEMAFCDLEGDMNIMEGMLKYVVKYVLDNLPEEMKFFDSFVEKGLIEKLKSVVDSKAVRISHKEAIDILLNSGVDFENLPVHGEDLSTEHEKYLTGEYFKSPVFVTDWPKDIKAFYMRKNNDEKTVAAVDLLVPGAGELMGGSQREERLDVLLSRMEELGMETEGLDWYLNLRKYGGCKHSGFGMGFERLLIYITGVENIRDVIPFPRTPGNCEF